MHFAQINHFQTDDDCSKQKAQETEKQNDETISRDVPITKTEQQVP